MGSLLNNALSGLMSTQKALSTTSHNISNANTEGYSRQRVEMRAQLPADYGSTGYIGNGTKVASVDRLYSDIVGKEMRGAISEQSRVGYFSDVANRVDDALGDSSLGLSSTMSEFFGAANDVANDPSSIPARQALIQEGESLATRFRTLDQQLAAAEDQANQRIRVGVENVNALSAELAATNHKITNQASDQAQPNDLLDQRDRLLNQLAQEVDIQTLEQDNGSITVFTANGQPWVMGDDSMTLSMDVDASGEPAIYHQMEAGAGEPRQEVTSRISGGAIGGALNVRNEVLVPARNDLGQIAERFVAAVNAQHLQGDDIDADAADGGGNLFRLSVAPDVVATEKNGSGSLEVEYDPASNLSQLGKEYTATYDQGAGEWTLSPAPNDGSSATISHPASGADFDGLSVTFSGTPQEGDEFQIRPRGVASGLEMAISDPREIAASEAGGGSTNNRNMLELANLETDATTIEGSQSFGDAYAGLVQEIGTHARQAETSRQAQDALVGNLEGRRESLSGVNLDEEAANLMRYQQAYQATARTISTANQLFQSLLNAV